MCDAAPQVTSAAVLAYAYAQQQGIDVDGNPAMPGEVKKALQSGANKFTSTGSVAKIPGGYLDALATVQALDIAKLQNLQASGSTAKASAGITVAALVVGVVLGCGLALLAYWIRATTKRKHQDRTAQAQATALSTDV